MGAFLSLHRRRSRKQSSKEDNNANRPSVATSYHPVADGEITAINMDTTAVETSPPRLSDSDVELLQRSWGVLKDEVSKVGVVMFMGLFETHPDVQQKFQPFKGLSQEEMMVNKELRTHALRVMGTVEKVLSRVHEPEKYEILLSELGSRHMAYGVRRNYILLMAPQFINALQSAMADHWSQELETAWYSLFKVISYYIVHGMTA